MADFRLEPLTELTARVPAASPPPADEDFHCPNCLYLDDPSGGPGFWACQNLCIRE